MDYLQYKTWTCLMQSLLEKVLNLIINGLPSILEGEIEDPSDILGFKPYYKWITFNTLSVYYSIKNLKEVLNLIINGLPSIL